MTLKFKLIPLFIMLCGGSALAETVVQLYMVDANGIGSSI